MIYVPDDLIYNACYVVQSEGVIRGYDRTPSYNTNYNYRDYYVNSNYIYRDGSGQWNQYSTLPTCLTGVITNDFYYRNDFPNILIIFFIFSIFVLYLPFKIIGRLFGKWLKL